MSSSLASATVAVDKATSDLLLGPDWTMNIEICDSVNSNHWQAKDVVKAVKKRLQHKSARVQLLALTLLETMVKNCGDYVHFQIAEKNILGEMVKIVKKKADMQVRDRILGLLEVWQEAFGGPGGKYPQYYWVYEELRRSGVQFPQRSLEAAPIFTPPPTHPTFAHPPVGYGMPSSSSRRLDEAMATEVEGLSLSGLDSIRDVMDLLNDMLQAVDPMDRSAVKDEVIVDLVERCRSNQKKLMQMLTSTGDEELLARGLELNDSLQSLLAKHDAISSGSPLPVQPLRPIETASKTSEVGDSSPRPSSSSPAPVALATKSQIDEEDEEEDDFALLARRHSKQTPLSDNRAPGKIEGSVSEVNFTDAASCKALVPSDPPARMTPSKEQDIIDLLSITLSSAPAPAPPTQTPHSASSSDQNTHHTPVSTSTGAYSQGPAVHQGVQGPVAFNSNYVVPWAQPQVQQQSPSELYPQRQSHQEVQLQPTWSNHSLTQSQPQTQPRPAPASYSQVQMQQQARPRYPQYQYGYPPPPWASSPENSADQQMITSTSSNGIWNPGTNTSSSYTRRQGGRSMQHSNSFPARASNGTTLVGVGDGVGPGGPGNATGQKPFIPSYRLFEDLDVFGSGDGRAKAANNGSPSLLGSSAQNMIGGRK